jgi:hypothetical protein
MPKPPLPRPSVFGLFFRQRLVLTLPWAALDYDPLVCASQVAEITGMHHHAKLICFFFFLFFFIWQY